MKYRKKPIEIEARHWDGTAAGATSIIDWILTEGGTARFRDYVLDENTSTGTRADPAIRINTLEGTMTAAPGDWIIRGVQGEFYPCKPDIFTATYDLVDETEQVDHRRVIGRSVQAMVNDRNGDESAFVTGWVLSYESASTDGLNQGYYGGGNITVEGQSPAMSRGLAQNCADFYNPNQWGADATDGAQQ